MNGPPPRRATTSGRALAVAVLLRVMEDGAWASRALDAELSRAQLPPQEAGRAADLLYGSLRSLRSVDALIDARRTKKGAVEPLVLAALRIAVFELTFTAAPSHAVVSEAVSLVKAKRGEGLARFANAILRRIADARAAAPRPRVLELPPWAHAELVRSVGEARAEAFLTAGSETPPLGLRAYGLERGALAARILAERSAAELAPSGLVARALVARRLGDARTLEAFRAGHVVAQDVGSQRVAELVGAVPGETVLDACAGRGGKSAVLAEAVGAEGTIVAVDLHERKLEELVAETKRLGLPATLETHTLDLTVGAGRLGRVFDRALVDAPCSGLGTVRRRPELLLRTGAEDPARMADTQLAIARNVAALVKPGGGLVVCTCSYAVAEGAALAERLEAAVPGLLRMPLPDADEDGVLRLGPWSDPERSSDVYQVVSYRVGAPAGATG